MINLSSTTPAAPSNNQNVTWQKSGTDVSAYVLKQIFDLYCYLAGKPGAGAVVFRHIFARTVAFGEDFLGSKCSYDSGPTDPAVYEIQQNGATIGTLTLDNDTSETVTFLYTATDSPPTFVEDDVLTLVAPDPQDATLEGVAITFAGVIE
jgi:hypothetical protein